MNPDVTRNITSSMSELQLEFLQHLKIQPLQTDLAAPDYLPIQPASELVGQVSTVVEVSQQLAQQSEAATPPPPAQVTTQWNSAEISSPLVQDILIVLQQAGVQAHWYYQPGTTDIHLTEAGLFSAPPQQFFTADSKKQLWRTLVQLLPDSNPNDTDPI